MIPVIIFTTSIVYVFEIQIIANYIQDHIEHANSIVDILESYHLTASMSGEKQ